MTRFPIVVEFVGNPASGKSTIAHELENQLRPKEVKIKNRTYSLTHETKSNTKRHLIMVGLALLSALRHPVQSLQIIWSIHKTQRRSLVDF